jgi:subtilisin inhibitor-like
MRTPAKILLAVLALVVAVLGFGMPAAAAQAQAAAAAQAAPAPSAAKPSVLTLTVAHGEHAATATQPRSVTLTCGDGTAAGTHPTPQAACAQLRAVHGDVRALQPEDRTLCPMIYDPVVVTAVGVWEGRRVRYERVFANPCFARSQSRDVFAF